MPHLDDPIARLVGRAAFYDALVQYWKAVPSRKPFTANPVLENEEIDLYFLFETLRALGGIQLAAKKRQLVVIRNMMLFSNRSTFYSSHLRYHHTRHCLPCYDLLANAVDHAYLACNRYTTQHSWIKPRLDFFQNNRLDIHPCCTTDSDVSSCDANAHMHYAALPETDDSHRDENAVFLALPEATRAAYRAQKNPFIIDYDEIHHHLFQGNSSRLVLLDLRNHIIRMWYRNTSRRLELEEAVQDVPSRYHQLAVRVFAYLLCTGTINFGAIPILNNLSLRIREGDGYPLRVAVVGAGISGLTAARQLLSLGMDVTVFEARSRPGGRIYTEKGVLSTAVDMGAMLITGLINNPTATIAKQTNADLHVVDTECPIFDVDGTWVSKQKDVSAFRFFNSCLDEAHEMRHDYDDKRHAATISLGEALTLVMRRRGILGCSNPLFDVNGESTSARYNPDEKASHTEICSTSNGKEIHDANLSNAKDDISIQEREESVEFRDSPLDMKFHFPRTKRRKVTESREHQRQTLMHTNRRAIPPVRKAETSDFRQGKLFKRLIRWHTANLEYGCASDLSSLSLMEWDQDDPHGFRGEHALIKNGYETIIGGLLEGIETRVKYLHRIVEVNTVLEDVVLVRVAKGQSQQLNYAFDAVIVTVPLGVLKKGAIDFVPPLPKKKSTAIARLGMGGLMKVALEFEFQFWRDVDVFGALRERAERRGEFYMFWNLARCVGKPVLMGVVCEPSVRAMESCSDQSVVLGAMKVLRRAYKDAPNPIAFSVSRWSKDEYAEGAYPFIPVGSSGDDYDVLAEPVRSIFFAGEHTCRFNTGTTGSGVISGLKAAYNVAMHLGVVSRIAMIQEQIQTGIQEENSISGLAVNTESVTVQTSTGSEQHART